MKVVFAILNRLLLVVLHILLIPILFFEIFFVSWIQYILLGTNYFENNPYIIMLIGYVKGENNPKSFWEDDF